VLPITGSGPQDRDETLMGHKPFLVLADYLTRKGIAVLRADDRGAGKSGGDFAAATTADFATDAEAGALYLKTRPEVDSKKIGLIGHSEGGAIAPLVASRRPEIAFIVMLAGPGVPGNEVIISQTALLAKASGASDAASRATAAKERDILAIMLREKDNAIAGKLLREQLAGTPELQMALQIRVLTSAWYRYFLAYDPPPAIEKTKCPVLALNGDKDTQVDSKLNLPAVGKALESGGNKTFELVQLPGLNHLFQHAQTGAVSEYGSIEETMSPAVLEKVASWILQR
jgi:pimeloyl-ACP methyl ester carboxylesterase